LKFHAFYQIFDSGTRKVGRSWELKDGSRKWEEGSGKFLANISTLKFPTLNEYPYLCALIEKML
jgi:hypothetical protein